MSMATSDGSGSLEAYFAESSDWNRSRWGDLDRSRRRAWCVALVAAACTFSLSLALLVLLPLKRVEPYLIRVDGSTGVVDVVPAFTGGASMPEAVTRYFLSHYVLTCERFDAATAESDYQECGAFHTARGNQAWYALWNPTNPASPLNQHRDGSSVAVDIESVSFLQPVSGVADLAQVRYRQIEHSASGASSHLTHWIATIQYAYARPSTDPTVRRWNPLGFKIVRFVSEPEVWRDPEGTAPAIPARGVR